MSEKYHLIFDWNMTETEGQCLKLAIIWEKLTQKMCPDHKLAKLPKNSDPRKCDLFRQCWKLLRLTRGLLKPEEFVLYIRANLQIILANNGRIVPNALCGDAAWIRWCVWKRLFERKTQEFNGNQVVEKLIVDPKIVRELDQTKLFLFEKCDGAPSVDKIKAFFKAKMNIWAGGKISYFYLVLSPWIGSLYSLKDLGSKLGFDPSLYEQKISDDVRKFFQKEFDYEFKKVVN